MAQASINAPTSGARDESGAGPTRGNADLQLYSLATPNGWKVGILLEELEELGVSAAAYDAHPVNIGDGAQFSAEFVKANPNSKIPAMIDRSGPDGKHLRRRRRRRRRPRCPALARCLAASLAVDCPRLARTPRRRGDFTLRVWVHHDLPL